MNNHICKRITCQRCFLTIFAVFVLARVTACGSKSSNTDKALEIIRNFLAGDYEYTITSTYISEDGSHEVLNEYTGKIIADPYQQHEIAVDFGESAGVAEQYMFQENEGYTLCMKTHSGGDGDQDNTWMTTLQTSAALKEIYARDGLEFVFDRIEKQNNKETAVYCAAYQPPSEGVEAVLRGADAGNVNLSGEIKLEYYLDMENEQVIQVLVDTKDMGRVNAIAQLIADGMQPETAEKKINESGNYFYTEILYTIKNFNGNIEINRPDTTND